MRTFKPGDIIRHFKRDFLSKEEKKSNQYLYKVIDIATHSETKEDMLVYQALYYPFKTFVRPLGMALEETPKEKYPDASQTYRLEIYNGED
jgi:hypothetical protein